MGIGRTFLGGTGDGIGISFDGVIEWLAAGATIDWTLVTPLAADVTLIDGQVIKAGNSMLRYGQVMTKVQQVEVQTVTINGTGGTYTLSLDTQTTNTVPLAYNATAQDYVNALEALPQVGAGNISSVTVAAGVYTVTFDPRLGNLPALTAVDSTTGAGHAVVIATSTSGLSNSGYWGPYDPTATDGRQTLTPGRVGIMPFTRTLNIILGFGPNGDPYHAGLLQGGRVWRKRILATSGAHSLAVGPTYTELQAAMPRLQLVDGS